MSKRLVLRLLGYLFSVVPPALAILERFPLWAEEGELLLSGIGLLLLLIAAIPLRRGIRAALRSFLASPSAPCVWGVLWLFTAWFGRIAVAIADIALIGTLSSLVGMLFFYLGKREVKKNEDG